MNQKNFVFPRRMAAVSLLSCIVLFAAAAGVAFMHFDSNSALAAQARLQAQLTTFASLGGAPDIYHMVEAPDGSFVVSNFRTSSLTRLSSSGAIIERVSGAFINPTSVVFYNQDVGYSACNPAPLASRGFCFSGRSGCPRGEGVAPGNISGASVPRHLLGTDAGLTSQTFLVANGGTGEIRRVEPATRRMTTIAGGFTIASVNANTRGPEQMAYNRNTRTIFVPDSGRGVLVAIDEAARSQRVISSGMNYPFGLALMPNGNLLLASRGDGALVEINQQGQIINTFDTGLGADALRGLCISSRGEIFLLADRTNTIYRVTLPAVRPVASVSAASFNGETLSSDAITAAFGEGLATTTEAASSLPLPASLVGTTVRVKDSVGVERLAPLFFVSPGQVNYLIPTDTAAGPATVTITSAEASVSAGTVQIASVSPGLFTANASGQGVAAAVALRIRADGSQSVEPVAQFDAASNSFVSVSLDLGPETDQVFLLLFGTGFRNHSGLSSVSASLGGTDAPVLFAGPQGDFAGLDQANLRLPRSLIGRGEVDVVLRVGSQAANTARLNIR